MAKCILNDKLVDENKAFIHVSDLALLRGYGIFDFLRLSGSKPLYLDDHIDRFFNSASFMQLECPLDKGSLKALINELLNHNKISDSGVRMVLTGGPSPNGYSIGDPTLIVLNEALSTWPLTHFTQGIKLISTSYKRLFPEIKTINYIKGIYMMPEVRDQNATDVLYYYHNKILETARSNFFLIDNNNLIKTSGENVLLGINRKYVLQLAKEHFDVEEGTVKLEELNNARETFITGTTKKITPVIQIDDKIIGKGTPGKATKWLMEKYDAFIDDYLKSVSPCF